MLKLLPFLSLVFSLAGRAQAETLPSFEASLDGVRAQADAARAGQLRDKRQDLSERIRVASVDVQALVNEIYGLPGVIFDLRRRSSDPRDPRLAVDVDNLSNNLRFTRERVASFLEAAQEFRREANRDMDLRTPAMDLARVSLNLNNKVRLVQSELAQAEGPLRHAGFDSQVQAIMDNSRLLADVSSRLAAETSELYRQIVSP